MPNCKINNRIRTIKLHALNKNYSFSNNTQSKTQLLADNIVTKQRIVDARRTGPDAVITNRWDAPEMKGTPSK